MFKNIPFSPRNYYLPTKGKFPTIWILEYQARRTYQSCLLKSCCYFTSEARSNIYLRSKEQHLPSKDQTSIEENYITKLMRAKRRSLTLLFHSQIHSTLRIYQLGLVVKSSHQLSKYPVKTIGCLPVFPHPITKIDTVHSLLQNC